MSKSFIPYAKQSLDAQDIQAVVRVLKSDFLTQGPKPGEFEAALCRVTGAKYAAVVASGTAALHLLALAMNLKPGDEVITTPMSFLATSNCILYTGAKPVFADIDPVTGNLDPASVKKLIRRRTRGIIATHLSGLPCDIQKLSSLAKSKKLFFIEDAAHALGAEYAGGRKVGDCAFSDAAILSFHPVKHITTAEGGAIVTNNKALHDLVCRLRTHGVTRDPAILENKNGGRWHYEMHELGYHYRITDMQAALGISQLKKLDRFVARRRAVAKLYAKELADIKGAALPVETNGSKHAYHLYPVRLTEDVLVRNKKQIAEDLAAAGVGTQVHYIPIPSQPYYRKLGYKVSQTPNAVRYFESELSLPMYPGLKDGEVKRAAKIFKRVINQYVKGEKYGR